MTKPETVERAGSSNFDAAGLAELAGANITTAEHIERLGLATRRLAATVAATERLAEARAEMLRTAGAVVGMGQTSARPKEIVSLAEAARRTGRHPEVLRRWCMDGRIPAFRIGRTWAISRETLNTLMRHRARSRPDFDGVDDER